jgi:peptide/nickel transport system substrate-binding protein
MRSRWIAGAVAVVTAVGLAGCTTGGGDDGEEKVIRIGVSSDQLSGSYQLDLHLNYGLDEKALFDPLFIDDPVTFELIPNVATGFERSDDWNTVTVELRDDIVFNDGTELTAELLADYYTQLGTIETWALKGIADPYAPTYTATGDYELTIESDKPMDLRSRGYLRQLLNTVPISTPAALDDLDGTATEPINAGAYLLEKTVPGVSATLVRNPEYWNPDAFDFDRIEITAYADEVAALNALQGGQIDATRLTPQLAVQAENQGFTIYEGNGRFTAMFMADWMGTAGSPMADKRVRQAIAYAFDREAILESINLGYGSATSCPFQSPSPEYIEGCEDSYGYDPDRARELLAEAGYADGFDVVLPTSPFLNINQWDAVVQQYLGDIGIRVTYNNYTDTGEYFGSMIGPNNPMFFYSEVFVQAIAVFINNSAILNSYDVNDPFVEEKYLELTSGPDDVAADAAQELGQYVIDEAILIPFAAVNYIWAAADGFEVTVGNSGENMLVQNFTSTD